MKRSLWAILLVLIIIGIALWLGAQAVDVNRERQEENSARQPAPPKTMNISGAKIAGRRDGKPFWHFNAERVEQNLEGGPTTFHKLREGNIYRDGEPYLSFTADLAVHDPKLDEIRLTGNLEAVFPEGTIYTEAASWSIMNEALKVTVPVIVVGDGYHLQAGGMEVDLQAEQARFYNGVILDQGEKGVVMAEYITKSLNDGEFVVPGPFTLEFEIDEAEEDSEDGEE
ncbi:MAG TPA: LPS export ABC transporter periplasmic protein LptC [Firmicutes bacterium]|jgi:LPS export ABC transporter protein LptC|nr:LPS export ABC transporter periplasmic protein LptC [Bacillota bacterium]HAW72129.1 LPS export ABC transporter periplasmic protein LptC [Bacillota bacterium]HAZ21851.1 LPS export ABC transporter periplasmic protein LptC [Bacillota bacterium]HBE06822.1 LPS export ABC transporter periplasmic protein LptC [Bacillota bacterium]HBG43924.1 LPS export ABC transporter periplasmic protein LptC [Bacillota bacterium]